MKRWSLRGVQLDLARQMETMEYIRGFTDFIAEHGHNVLVLYLEGRIRTPSFPYARDEESYTPDQMREIVQHAQTRGVEVVPVVSNLGHAEQFLQYPELAHLAELRNGRPGRMGSSDQCVCPSLKETWEFFEAYFSEVSEVFPSSYFHIGNDEAWDIGYCDLCRPRAEADEGQAGIFAKHLRDTHAIITGKLGKRIIMWDDLFEQYQTALEEIPRDIVMCCWQYDNSISLPNAHFQNQRRQDLFAEYDRLGFEYLAAPRETSWRNIASLTQYAVRYQPLGGLLTTWEGSCDFLHAYYPNIAFAGRLWSEPDRAADSESLFGEVAAGLLPGADAADIDAVRGALGLAWFHAASDVAGFLRESPDGRRTERALINRMLTAALERHQGDGETALDILDDLLTGLGKERLQLELADLVPRVYDLASRGESPSALAPALRACLEQADALYQTRKRQWQKHRPGVLSTRNSLETHWTSLRESLAGLVDAVEAGQLDAAALVTIEYFLPDAFSCQWVRVLAKYAGSEEWEEIAHVMPKPLFFKGDDEHDHAGYFRVSHPVDPDRPMEQCRIEAWGYGGIGIRHVEIRRPSGNAAPRSVESTAGTVTQPHRVLDTSSLCCWLGEPDTGLAFLNPGLASVRHSLVVAF